MTMVYLLGHTLHCLKPQEWQVWVLRQSESLAKLTKIFSADILLNMDSDGDMRRTKKIPENNGKRPCNHGNLNICIVCQYNDDCPYADGSDRDRALWTAGSLSLLLSFWGGAKPGVYMCDFQFMHINYVSQEIACGINAGINYNNTTFIIEVEEWKRYSASVGIVTEKARSAVFTWMAIRCVSTPS